MKDYCYYLSLVYILKVEESDDWMDCEDYDFCKVWIVVLWFFW